MPVLASPAAPRLVLARVVRSLVPAAAALGGWVSAHARIVGAPSGPAVVLSVAPYGPDGRCDDPPLLAILVQPAPDAQVARWWSVGARGVWVVGPDDVVVTASPGSTTRPRAVTSGSLAVPGRRVRIDVGVLLASTSGLCRLG